jgi:hypothetical protein
MPRSFGNFALYRSRTTLRRRLGGYLAVVLLGGLLGGLAMGAVAGARRTQSAYPEYLASSHTSQLTFTYNVAGSNFEPYLPAFERRIAHLRGVEHVGAAPYIPIEPVTAAGRQLRMAVFANNELATVGSFGGMYVSQDRPVADQGRLYDPRRVSEFEMTELAAHLTHWHVGQIVRMGAFSLSQLVASNYSSARLRPVEVIRARLVGIVSDAATVANDQVDQFPGWLIFTPALTSKLPLAALGYPIFSLAVAGGAPGVTRVERELIALLPPHGTYTFNVVSVHEGAVERAIEPVSIALGAFGVITGLATLVIVAQATTRGVRRNTLEFDVLRALGASPSMLVVDGVGGLLVALVMAAALAVVVSLAVSPMFPIGAVRQVDPSPGLHADGVVLLVGLAVLVAAVGVLALGLTVLTVRRSGAHRTSDISLRPSRVAGAATEVGMPASAVMGIRFALERGGPRTAVPVGSTLLGCALAVGVVTATLTFGSGLSTLVSRPALYGWNWDYAITELGGGNVPAVTGAMLSHDRDVESWTGFNGANVQIDGQEVPILMARPGAPIGPPILAGRGLERNDEIVLGGATLAQLHKEVGDYVSATYGSPKDLPIYVPPTRLRIVGAATMPAIGNGGASGIHPSMGSGGIISRYLPPLSFRRALLSPDPNLNGPALVAVRLRPSVPPAAALASLERIARRTDRIIDADPRTGGGTYIVESVQQPAEIVNYKTVGSTPAYLALALALGAVVALALTLLASIRRRRRDLALLRTLGFVQRQLAAVVSWQATMAAAVGIAVGIPLGIVVGRQLWTAFARTIYAVANPTVPTGQLALVALAALVLANVVALVPGRLAARTPTAAQLRSE